MPLPSKADFNVPALPGRARYSIVNTSPTWCYDHMAAGIALAGDAPRSAAKNEAAIDPVVTSGKAEYRDLTKGGLFTIQAKAKKPLVVDALDNAAGAALTIVSSGDSHSRAAPTTVPFKVGPGEVLKAVGGTAGSYIGILYRIDGEVIW